MLVLRSLPEIRREKNSVVTVGTFDGVHLAHQEIIREVVHRAKMKEGRSVVITFDPHPKAVLGNQPVHLLTTINERIDRMTQSGVDVLFVIEFTQEFSKLDSQTFFEKYLVHGTGVSEVVVGYDHMFGRNREGTTEELVRLGQKFDFSVFALHPYTVNGETVSSTLIRKSLSAGDIERARSLLGYDYTLRGAVVQGDGRGRSIGYPTANIELDSDSKLIPGEGVYFVAVRLGEKDYFGMMNIGVRPTVTKSDRQTIEVHLFDFSNDIYGEKIGISFVRKLRDEQKFASLQELVLQLDSDKQKSLQYIREYKQRN